MVVTVVMVIVVAVVQMVQVVEAVVDVERMMGREMMKGVSRPEAKLKTWLSYFR